MGVAASEAAASRITEAPGLADQEGSAGSQDIDVHPPARAGGFFLPDVEPSGNERARRNPNQKGIHD